MLLSIVLFLWLKKRQRLKANVAKTNRLGPFSELQINKIKSKLDPLGHKYKIEIDEDLLFKYQDEISNKAYYERYQSPITPLGEFLFIEISSEALMVIKKYLNELGMSSNEEAHFIPDTDLYCPRCDYSTQDLALCPKHRLPLVDYYTKTRLEKQAVPSKNWVFNALIFGLVVLLIAFYIVENFILKRG